MTIAFDKVSDIIYRYFQNVSMKPGGTGLNATCAICGDSKTGRQRRFHIDYYSKFDSYVARCYNGDCALASHPTDIITLYTMLSGISYRDAKKELSDSVYEPRRIKAKVASPAINTEPEPTITVPLDLDINDCLTLKSVPDGRIQERYYKALSDFVTSRKITVECLVAIRGRQQGRIIIPIIDNGVMTYFQGRAISDDMSPKYLNSTSPKEDVVMNRGLFHKDKFIIVTEGPIDAMMINDSQGTTSIGATISEKLLEVLFPLTDKGVIIALDNPNIDKAGYTVMMDMISNHKYGKKLRYFLMPHSDCKDLNNLVVKRGVTDVYEFVVKHSYTPFYIATKFKLK